MARYKGLTSAQRDRLLLACREDTCVDDGGGFPARQSDITTPANSDTVEAWTDASRGGAFLNARLDDTCTYDGTGVRLESANTEDFHVVGNLNRPNKQYFERLRTGAFTLVIRIDLKATPGTSSKATILGDATPSGTNGFELRYETDGNGNAGVRVVARNGGSDLYDTGQQDVSVDSGLETITVEHDPGTALTVDYDGTEVASISGATMATGTDSDNVLGIGTSGGLSADGDLDATIQGVLLDTQAGNGQAAEAWIKGQNYTP